MVRLIILVNGWILKRNVSKKYGQAPTQGRIYRGMPRIKEREKLKQMSFLYAIERRVSKQLELWTNMNSWQKMEKNCHRSACNVSASIRIIRCYREIRLRMIQTFSGGEKNCKRVSSSIVSLIILYWIFQSP